MVQKDGCNGQNDRKNARKKVEKCIIAYKMMGIYNKKRKY